ncbi:MAG: MEDS domain-containing protein [Mycobacteriales bacterium]
MALDLRPAPLERHSVIFYNDDQGLIEQLAHYTTEGLAKGERVLLFATAEHRAALANSLERYAVDLAAAHSQGDYREYDAAKTLTAVMGDSGLSSPDPERFDEVVEGFLGARSPDRRPVRVFSELAALLCAADRTDTAVELESLWNRLGNRRPFCLRCACPQPVLNRMRLREAGQLCRAHTRLLPPPSYIYPVAPAPVDQEFSAVFIPVPPSRLHAGSFRRLSSAGQRPAGNRGKRQASDPAAQQR